MGDLGKHLAAAYYPKGTLAEPFMPIKLDGVEAIFPAGVARLMPPVEAIPDEYLRYAEDTKFGRLFRDMFHRGLAVLELTPKEGIDKDIAWRHLLSILGSWEPKHQYKEAAFTYLLTLWFDDVQWLPMEKDNA